MTTARSLPGALIGAVALLGLAASTAPAGAETGLEIMKKQRDLHRIKDEEEQQQMIISDRGGRKKERRVVRYTRTDAEDLNKILIRFRSPRDVENTGLLTWEKKDGDDDQWLYLPSVGKEKRIASSGKKNRFMGTDFSFEDLRPEAIPLHRYELVGGDKIDGQECWVIEAVPATDRQASDSGYSKRKLWVQKSSYYTVKREFYDKKGKLEKVETSRKVLNVAGTVWRANEVEMQDVQDGTRTVVVIENRLLNRGLKDDVFTLESLKRGS